jgi:threonine/homoserine/homoserine lactone efflux protein
MLVVAASVLPGAALGRSPAAAWTLLLGLVFCLITVLWLGACTALASRAGGRLPVRLVGALSGGALTALGVRLLLA